VLQQGEVVDGEDEQPVVGDEGETPNV